MRHANESYLQWLNSIPVTPADLLEAAWLCGEPEPEDKGCWRNAMKIGELHPYNPAKANVILCRLEALSNTLSSNRGQGWTLTLSKEGITVPEERIIAAAAMLPLGRNEQGFCFDRVSFVSGALSVSRPASQKGDTVLPKRNPWK